MSYSKPLPPFTYDLLCYLNRNQLERFSIVCRPLKNLIDRYFHSKPYRVFDRLIIRGGSYALSNNGVFCHPNRGYYSAQQFLSAQKCNVVLTYGNVYYSFAEMRLYLGSTVRINSTIIYVAGDPTYNPKHIEELESITYLWRDRVIRIFPVMDNHRIVAEDFQLILNSPNILQCRELDLFNADFSFKDYKVLYSVEVIRLDYSVEREINLSHWHKFLEQPGVKPVVALQYLGREKTVNLIDRLKEAFSSSVSRNAFKILFVECKESLTEFRETNKTSDEKMELKKGLPVEYQKEHLKEYDNYILERSNI